MAGGPTTPALVNAVTFGFLALGTCTPAQARQWLAQCQAPFGANLFMPHEEPLLDDVSVTAQLLHANVPTVDVTSGFQEKFSLVLEAAPAVVSSMFGAFTHEQVDQLHAVGSQAWVTVTSVSEAHQALHADGLIVQGPLAGGHRGTWDQRTEPGDASLGELLTQIVPLGLPVIAAGGVRGPEDVARAGVPVACGTAFLLADEAGTSPRNRELLRSDAPAVVTRAFSGRWASGVETAFTRAHPDLPPTYPYLRPMTSTNDYCLVGADRGELLTAPAGEIERMLTG